MSLISRSALFAEINSDREAAQVHHKSLCERLERICDYAETLVENAPAVDAEPVRHGRWIWADDGYLRCSECTQKAPITTQYQDEPIQTATDYCPHCGAKMDGGNNEQKTSD